MKKLKLLAAVSVICTGLQSQPYTGITTYQHASVGAALKLSDGTNTNFNSTGFIMSGHLPSTPGAPVLYIDKRWDDGTVNSGIDFSYEYKFAADPVKPCGGNVTGAANCYGMTLSELKFPTGNEWYVIAAAFDRGCLYSGIDQNGNAVSPAYYTFPVGATNPTKALITSSVLFPGKFYICGSYRVNGLSHMYIMLIGLGGGVGWSWDYTTANARELTPSAIMESPYAPASSPEIAVVGFYNNGSIARREGFFSRFKATNGSPLQFSLYDGPAGTSSNERFSSIASAVSTSYPAGYVIGGASDLNPAQGTSWMLRVDQFGAIQWSSIILPSSGTNGGVTDVVERYSAAYNQYEYYGSAIENNGLTVFKLDEFGGAFFQPGNTENEFIYNDNLGGTAVPVAITYNDDSTIPNTQGIAMYATNNTGTGDYMLTRACFNGAAGNPGCSNITLNTLPASNVSPGPMNVTTSGLSQIAGPPPCTVFGFGGGPTPVNDVVPCNEYVLPSAPYAGNQSRTSAVTGIKSAVAGDKFSVSPNPVSDRLTISYTSNAGADVSVSVFNNLGQLVSPAVTPKPLDGQNELSLDLSTMNINSGVYFVKVNMNGVVSTKKIVYTK